MGAQAGAPWDEKPVAQLLVEARALLEALEAGEHFAVAPWFSSLDEAREAQRAEVRRLEGVIGAV